MDYSSLQSKAASLILTAGVAATLQRITEGAYDPATLTTAASSTTSYSGYAVLTSIRGEEFGTDTLVQAGDKGALLDATNFTSDPIPGDRLVVASKTYSVVNVKNIEPGGTSLIFKLHLRVS